MIRELLLGLVVPAALSAQAPGAVRYDVRFTNLAHHEIEISATFPNLARRPLEVRMSRSSPGRYALHEFAKNVYAVRATDSRGRSLAVTRPNPHQWNVGGHDGTVTVAYTLFGDRGDGTYAQFDRTQAHFNMPAAFIWARGLDRRPIRLTFHDLPQGWRVATQLAPTSDSSVFTAPGLQYFMDSPTRVGPIDIRRWTESSGARVDTIRLAIQDPGTSDEVDRYVELIKRIVREERGVFGELAPYDYGTYTFIANYLPYASGDGMEHRNSTMLSGTQPLRTGMMGNLSTVAHEFFHSWNVERIRPKGLEPFSFEEANMAGELWLAEGFTSYYGPLAMRRAGTTSNDDFTAAVGGAADAVINDPGRRYFSPVDMSRQAPFVDAAVSIDPQNKANTFISYYTWGEALGLGLDLTLRTRFPSLTLDDFMRAMWREFGKPELRAIPAPARGYTVADARRVLGVVTRDTAFANDFFRRYIEGTEVVDYAALLERAGFAFRKAQAARAWIGNADWTAAEGGVALTSPALVGTPLYDAGLERGDLVVSFDGKPMARPEDIEGILSQHHPGEAVGIDFKSRGGSIAGRITIGENPQLELVPFEAAGRQLTDEMRTFRGRWLGSQAGAN